MNADTYLASFSSFLTVTIDAKALANVTPRAWAEAQLFICDAIHSIIGPQVFVDFKTADYNQFTVCGDSISEEQDDKAWEEVVRYIHNAQAVSAL